MDPDESVTESQKLDGTARIRTGVIGTQGRKDTKLPHGPARFSRRQAV